MINHFLTKDWEIRTPKAKVLYGREWNHPALRKTKPTSVFVAPHPVVYYSPAWARRNVWRFATYFRREFSYNFVQYGHEGREDDENCIAWLWSTIDASYGAAAFRLREWRDAPPSWGLQWIWLHPYARRRGELTKVWPTWKAIFGDFDVEGPLSSAMQAFCDKMNKRSESHEMAQV